MSLSLSQWAGVRKATAGWKQAGYTGQGPRQATRAAQGPAGTLKSPLLQGPCLSGLTLPPTRGG